MHDILIPGQAPNEPRDDSKPAAAREVALPGSNVAERQQKPSSGQGEKAEITSDDFARLDLRVAVVASVELIKGADRLLKLEVNLGTENRTVVAGIAQHYQPLELLGKRVVIVANLAPTTLWGITSQGMVLAAADGKDLGLVTVERGLSPGARVR